MKNNVTGTRLMAEMAARPSGAARFVLVSTDKAVRPSSVMGATKRVAELILQAHARRQPAKGARSAFTTVRFGNVLGSSGSVVPAFLRQLRAGGPITVTHPEVRRYFMLIPEAVQLMLHAAALTGTPAAGGATCVLNLGSPIRIVDLARNLIHLTGLTPDVDIPIIFTGLRPGEKLSEELISDDEEVRDSSVPEIQIVADRHPLTHRRSTPPSPTSKATPPAATTPAWSPRSATWSPASPPAASGKPSPRPEASISD